MKRLISHEELARDSRFKRVRNRNTLLAGIPDDSTAIAKVLEEAAPAIRRRVQGTELESVSNERDVVKTRASNIYDMVLLHFLRAEVLNEMGRHEEAMQLYTAAADASLPLVPASHLRIGEIHEERGEIDQAVERYSEFVDLWSGADPEYQPLVEDVRNRISRLVGEPMP